MAERPTKTFRSGDALFAFDADLTIVSWNRAAEAVTGVSAEAAVGRCCWEVLGGHDEGGSLICHPGCSTARLAREGWPVSCQELLINAGHGKRRVALSTVAIGDGDRPLLLHVMVPDGENRPGHTVPGSLTPRQQEVLRLLADGVPAKVIATRLGLAEPTVRNHIRGILAALETHSLTARGDRKGPSPAAHHIAGSALRVFARRPHARLREAQADSRAARLTNIGHAHRCRVGQPVTKQWRVVMTRTRHTPGSAPPAAVVAEALAPGVDRYERVTQYPLRQIAAVGAAAAVRMGVLTWVVAPALKDRSTSRAGWAGAVAGARRDVRNARSWGG